MRYLPIVFLVSALLPAQQEQTVKFESTSNLVVVNVSVKDRDGQPLTGLKADDFAVFEDNKRVKLSVFEYQKLSRDVLPAPEDVKAASSLGTAALPATTPTPAVAESYKDRRLMVLFFDLASMAPRDLIHADEAARKFIRQQMTASDLVAIASFSSRLELIQDFTADRERLLRVIQNFEGKGSDQITSQALTGPTSLTQGSTQESSGAAGSAAGDDAEFSIFNTDRRLSALEELAKILRRFPERKAIIYISSGVERTGLENESQLRSTINAAVRSNVAFFPIDARGLTAGAPAGDASMASGSGASLFSGSIVSQSRSKCRSEQDTLVALASDTGGKALLDSNDLTIGMRQAQQAIDSYYVLGYYAPNDAADGKFRKIRVELKSAMRAKLDYRPGYFASKTFRLFNEAEKERQLEEALALPTPLAEIPIAIEIDYFRLAKRTYFVPVAMKIPGSAITMLKKRGREEAQFDFIGAVKNSKNATVGTVRDTIRVKLSSDDAGQLPARSLQYDTAFTLAPGEYTFKLLVRENQEGKIGTFLTHYTIPDVATEATGVRLSSVILSGQREKLEAAVGSAGESRKKQERSPLVSDGQKLVPSITRVLSASQSLFVYFEVYDAAPDPSVSANLSLYQGKQLVFESQEVRLTKPLTDRPETIPFQIQLPLTKLRPGRYTAQVNVIDETGRKFGYARSPLVLTP